jgi:hypothetical protein
VLEADNGYAERRLRVRCQRQQGHECKQEDRERNAIPRRRPDEAKILHV